ncbi:unnamed protein product [Discosporangium mesarthrocarpum]
MEETNPMRMKVVELKAKLGERGLSQTGLKFDLAQRLQAAMDAEEFGLDTAVGIEGSVSRGGTTETNPIEEHQMGKVVETPSVEVTRLTKDEREIVGPAEKDQKGNVMKVQIEGLEGTGEREVERENREEAPQVGQAGCKDKIGERERAGLRDAKDKNYKQGPSETEASSKPTASSIMTIQQAECMTSKVGPIMHKGQVGPDKVEREVESTNRAAGAREIGDLTKERVQDSQNMGHAMHGNRPIPKEEDEGKEKASKGMGTTDGDDEVERKGEEAGRQKSLVGGMAERIVCEGEGTAPAKSPSQKKSSTATEGLMPATAKLPPKFQREDSGSPQMAQTPRKIVTATASGEGKGKGMGKRMVQDLRWAGPSREEAATVNGDDLHSSREKEGASENQASSREEAKARDAVDKGGGEQCQKTTEPPPKRTDLKATVMNLTPTPAPAFEAEKEVRPRGQHSSFAEVAAQSQAEKMQMRKTRFCIPATLAEKMADRATRFKLKDPKSQARHHSPHLPHPSHPSHPLDPSQKPSGETLEPHDHAAGEKEKYPTVHTTAPSEALPQRRKRVRFRTIDQVKPVKSVLGGASGMLGLPVPSAGTGKGTGGGKGGKEGGREERLLNTMGEKVAVASSESEKVALQAEKLRKRQERFGTSWGTEKKKSVPQETTVLHKMKKRGLKEMIGKDQESRGVKKGKKAIPQSMAAKLEERKRRYARWRNLIQWTHFASLQLWKYCD